MSIYRGLDPSLSLVYVPYDADEMPESKPMSGLIEDLMKTYNQKILVIDMHHSTRWEQGDLDPIRCRGDASFYMNDGRLSDKIKVWFNTTNSGVPRSVDDVTSEDFLEAIEFFAEESQLDALSSYAFAGREED
jgi:hypothetical protein